MARFKFEAAPRSLEESRVATDLLKLATTVPEPALRGSLTQTIEVIKKGTSKWPVGPPAQFVIIQEIFGDKVPLRSSLDTVNEKGLFVHEKITVGDSRLVVRYRPQEMVAVITFLQTKDAIEKHIGHEVMYQTAALEMVRRLGFAHPLISSFEEKFVNAELIKTHRRETDFTAIIKELEKTGVVEEAKSLQAFLLQRTGDFLSGFPYFPLVVQDIASSTLMVFDREDDEKLAARVKTDFIKRPPLPKGIHLYDGNKLGVQSYYPRDLLALWAFLYEAGFLSPESGENRLTPVEAMRALNRVVLKLGEDHPISLRLNVARTLATQ